jgi:hypothetical protein
MGKARGLQGTVDRVVRDRDAKLLLQQRNEVAGAPAHHAVHGRDRTFLDHPAEERPMFGLEFWRNTRRGIVDETLWSMRIEPDHPIPQRLTVHPADPCSLRAGSTIEHRRDRQQPTRLCRVFCLPSQAPQLISRVVVAQRDGLSHGKLHRLPA